MTSPDPFVKAEQCIQTSLARLPAFLSRWFGYRGEPLPPSSTYVVCFWGFIGSFGGLGILFAIFGHTAYFTSRNVSPLVASYGASAILCYGAIDIPLAQPRALVLGHFFSALTGIVIAIIFDLDLSTNESTSRFQWLAACLATAIALVIMHLTKTTHPPAGATALLPCVDASSWALKWYFLPIILLSSGIVLASALCVNNIQQQYPKFWIAPRPLSMPPPQSRNGQHRHRGPPDMTGLAETRRSHHNLRDFESA